MASAERSLHALESSLQSIFMQVGSVFGETDETDVFGLWRASTRLQESLPKAVDNFEGSLNMLQSELTQAMSVLQNDMATEYLRKMQSEDASGAENPGEVGGIEAKNEMETDVKTEEGSKTATAAAVNDEAGVPSDNKTTLENATKKESTEEAKIGEQGQTQAAESKPETPAATAKDERQMGDSAMDTTKDTSKSNEEANKVAEAQQTGAAAAANAQKDNTNTGEEQPIAVANGQADNLNESSFDMPSENLDSILPGLHEYANDTGNDPSFSNVDDMHNFVDDMNVENNGNDNNHDDLFGDGGDDMGGGEFADLIMDVDFGAGNNGNNGMDDSKFNADFFNLD